MSLPFAEDIYGWKRRNVWPGPIDPLGMRCECRKQPRSDWWMKCKSTWHEHKKRKNCWGVKHVASQNRHPWLSQSLLRLFTLFSSLKHHYNMKIALIPSRLFRSFTSNSVLSVCSNINFFLDQILLSGLGKKFVFSFRQILFSVFFCALIIAQLVELELSFCLCLPKKFSLVSQNRFSEKF